MLLLFWYLKHSSENSINIVLIKKIKVILTSQFLVTEVSEN